MRQWSRYKEPFLRWIEALRERFGSRLHLIIADDTGFDIPWELVFLSEEGDVGASLLGSVVPVSRWQPVHGSNDVLREPPATCTGPAVAYVSSSISTASTERATFRDHSPLRSTNELRTRLRQEDAREFALVYMACEGSFSNDISECSIGSPEEPERISLLDLDTPRELRALAHVECLVFLNACESVRPALDPNVNDGHPRGFHELFLRRGARGVIGTTGLVDSTVAAEIAEQFVERASAPGGIAPSLELHEIRRREAQSIIDDSDATAHLLWVFMYAYFGHPLTRLHLTAGGAP
jgi:hypothetical protein